MDYKIFLIFSIMQKNRFRLKWINNLQDIEGIVLLKSIDLSEVNQKI